MRSETGQIFHLTDYAPYDFTIHSVELSFDLSPDATMVKATLILERANHATRDAPLFLNGEDLTLKSVSVNGEALPDSNYLHDDAGLTISTVPESGKFEVVTMVEINPTANTQLMGLYRSSGNFCTQCEAEGFRRITFYPDRPDVMSVFTTHIRASKSDAKQLLSNGNLIASTDDGNYHSATWHDPHPKPAYLFALVGCDLGVITDKFTTMNGRNVDLEIYVEHGKEHEATYAMDVLKRSMRWDEEVFAREYDLEIFMVVAVSDFNMGAMENKGLNIFNDRLVLASPDTATDANYNAIEAVIAHEYFHNWTGNRITCRDWFQLCLKEGLTVYRDSEFTADMRSRPVKRIEDVVLLRATQFPEDAGPLAHPVRPASYQEINNFYTATVYEKGSEVVRMLHTVLGAKDFKKGIDLYFERHDGEATTIEAWLKSFEDATGRDLSQFALWYSQAGTPLIKIEEEFEVASGTYNVKLEQVLPETPDRVKKRPMHIPFGFGLLNADGTAAKFDCEQAETNEGILHLKTQAETFRFTGLNAKPVLSILRDFSAPVRLQFDQTTHDRLILAAHDSDPFNRWQAVQDIAMAALKSAVLEATDPADVITMENGLGSAIRNILMDIDLDPTFRAFCLNLPSAGTLAQEIGQDVNPDQLQGACDAQSDALAHMLKADLTSFYKSSMPTGTFDPGAEGANARQLANACLTLLVRTGDPKWAMAAKTQFYDADNMTNRMAAMSALVHHEDGPLAQAALRSFEDQFGENPLVMDLWLGLQARKAGTHTLETVKQLTSHPSFSFDTPNRVYALIRTFAMANLVGFNQADGGGYEFIADCVIKLNAKNPQVAARVLTAFRSWKMLEPIRSQKAQMALRRIANTKSLSTDVADIVSRTLK